jgi:hypothetical protein
MNSPPSPVYSRFWLEQLYLYGFLKVQSGPDEGSFHHPKFVRGDHDSCLSLRRNQFEGDRRLRIKLQNRSTSPTKSQSNDECILHEPNNNKEADLSLIDQVISILSSPEEDDDDTISDRRQSTKLQDRSPSPSSQTNDECIPHKPNNKKETVLGLIDQVISVLSSDDDEEEDTSWQTLFEGGAARAMLDLADCGIPQQVFPVHSSEDDDDGDGTGWQALFEGGVRNTNLNEDTSLFDLEPRSIEEMISRTEP